MVPNPGLTCPNSPLYAVVMNINYTKAAARDKARHHGHENWDHLDFTTSPEEQARQDEAAAAWAAQSTGTAGERAYYNS
ncbi:hypothetical protein LAROYE_41 [Arthrobacter phage Laroye]|uniref:Uncharacterized protein n=1 Tax=Arthrobacter phage Laroye TaxID=1772305 RepID=A0A0U4B496_9CAUD|nr:hypothetical protein FDH64_gp41 [Arthrobacter phage Laroye]ALY09568.1 hypothetical protein LAROYE_41 [Arthrobacter phage Laroye]